MTDAGACLAAGPDAPMTTDAAAAEALAAICRQAAVLHVELQRAVAIFVHGPAAAEVRTHRRRPWTPRSSS